MWHLNSWEEFFKAETSKDYFKKLMSFLDFKLSQNTEIYPSKSDWFKALELCNFQNLKVVIIGQDPYHSPGVADGLAFSTNKKILPPSLKNIFKELKNNYPKTIIKSGNLSHWANQGVLLINRVLTVEKNNPQSHYNQGWEIFTENLLKWIVTKKQKIVFVLLGSKAQTIEQQVDLSKQCIIRAPHPSPLSAYRGFFGSEIFIKINSLLDKKIIW
ncbi:uracil-DNA glycosylase [Mycoplasma iguanae]|uniref:Uracil-DNA glycosylase n=1 Tax=Mycoplasma iguanae TaxID=292461 RepID=A0ABY5R847_9MOLU|nr:uracil-DNA glycosylase [Mycoplasma iguanae]UVD81613.1 uracil-DNA glycosylase [Mycoplasma iguanae]